MMLVMLAVFSMATLRLDIIPEKKELFIGEPVKVEVHVPADIRPNVQSVEPASNDVYVFGTERTEAGFIINMAVYKLNAVEVPFKVMYLNDEGVTEEKKLPGITFKVKETVSEDEVRIKPIRGVIGLFNWMWLLPALIMAVILITYIYLQKRRKYIEAANALTPEEWAEKRLLQIRDEKLPEKGLYKEYYDAISDCLRYYLQIKYDIPAMELTLGELLDVMKKYLSYEIYLFKSESYFKIRNLLKECDLVKFTPAGRTYGTIESIWDQAYGMVKHDI